MKHLYLVVFDWSTYDDHAVDIEIYDTYEKAVNRFNEIIEREKSPEMSWASMAFDKNGKLNHDYTLDELKPNIEQETDAYWDITCKLDWCYHDYLSIRKTEVL